MIFRVDRVDTGKEVNLNLNQIAFFEDVGEGTTSIVLINGATLTVKTTARKVRTQFRRMAGNTVAEEAAETPAEPAPEAAATSTVTAPAPTPVEAEPAPFETAPPAPVEVEEQAPVPSNTYNHAV